MPDGYRLEMSPPSTEDYVRLRLLAGLTPRTAEQGGRALAGSWTACHAVDETTGDTIAMGRVIGDGGWYFHIADIAVLPDHQRRGLGDQILTALLERIRAVAPPGAFVTLMADPPGRRLYARHGFTEKREKSIGMAMWLD